MKSVHLGDTDSSPLKVMKLGNNSMAKTALTGAGPKIKVLPFRKVPELSLQSAFIIPNTQDLENPRVERPFLEHNSFIWWTQVFYDYAVDDWLSFFLEADALARFSREDNDEGTFVQSPFSFFASFYPTRKFTVYGMFQLSPTYGDNFTSSFYTQTGGGMKYQIFKGFEIELLYTNFILGENSGAGQTYNIGFRYLR